MKILIWLTIGFLTNGCMQKTDFISARKGMAKSDSGLTFSSGGETIGISLTSSLNHLPYPSLYSKLKFVTGLSRDAYREVENRKLELGAHDFANGEVGGLSWNPNKLESWIKAITPICASPDLKAKYTDRNYVNFASQAMGRSMEAFEEQILHDAFKQGRFELVCLLVLSSLEFVTM